MRRRTITLPATAIAIAALAAPPQAGAQDLRSPDARASAPAPYVAADLRTPDSRDAGEGRGTFNAPEVVVVPGDAPAVGGGIDWIDAGIGAAGLLAMIGLGLAGAALVGHHRRGPATGVSSG
jgi:hypothetical protein